MLTAFQLDMIQKDLKQRYPPPYPTHIMASAAGLRYLHLCFGEKGLQLTSILGLKVCYNQWCASDELHLCYFLQGGAVRVVLKVIRILETDWPRKPSKKTKYDYQSLHYERTIFLDEDS